MPDEVALKNPWLVAVWPGMGHVGVTAGYYLMAKLGMNMIGEIQAQELFDIEHVEVKEGLIKSGRLPRNRFFAWSDPLGRRDIVVLIGEAQPAMGKYSFCRVLVHHAKQLGVERMFTFAAMGTPMHPSHDARVFAAATDAETLEQVRRGGVEILEEGQIGGLNGVLLGAAVDEGMPGACLLGEMPHIFAHLTFPKASLAILEVFSQITGVEIDLEELGQQAKEVEQKLGELLEQVERTYQEQIETQRAPGEGEPSALEPGLLSADWQHIEELFERARQDRSVAYELKRELDRLGVYHEYENRFLDLFKKSE